MKTIPLISPICSQHKLFLETGEEAESLEGVQVKPGDALSTVVVPAWSKLVLHSVVARDGQTIVWRLFSVETNLARAADAQAAKAMLEAFKAKMEEVLEASADESNEDYENGEIPTTGEAPVAAPEHGN